MKYIFGFLFILTLCCQATAAHFSLAKIDPNAYEISIEKIKGAIAADDTKKEILPFNNSQSFLLKDQDQQRIGYLIPVKFNSKSYQNTICRLYFLDLNDNLKFAELFAEKNDDDDIVSSCIGIDAASIHDKTADEAFYLAVMRYRTINTYGSKGVILTYKNGILFYDKKNNNCINASGEITNIKSLKKKLLSCM
jgi:hypothetical protein